MYLRISIIVLLGLTWHNQTSFDCYAIIICIVIIYQ